MKNLTLNNDEIHVWYFNFSCFEEINKFKKLLSIDEKNKSQKFIFEKDKKEYTICRGVLRILLSKYLNIEPKKIMFNYNKYGKPSLNGNRSNIKFNVSHSKDMCTIAINQNNDIGIDIEFINPKVDTDDIVKDFFSEYEIKNYFNIEKKERLKMFYKIWTRKESLIKAYGMGLSISLDSFDVDMKDENPEINWNKNLTEQKKFSLYNIKISNDYCSALVNNGIRKKINIANLNLVI